MTRNLNFYIALLASIWSIIILLALWNQLNSIESMTMELAETEARTIFEKDIATREWSSKYGGVYIPVTDDTPPNPYLSHIKDRDIVTPSGKQLTLLNPSYMIRKMAEEFEEAYGVAGHITSAKPLRPENAPDEWEKQAMAAFEKGQKEISQISMLNGKPYLRLMQPM